MRTNVLVLMGMVRIAYVVIVIRRDKPTKEGESVLMRGDKWVTNCRGGGCTREERCT